jgi:hypothetical protein
MVPRGNLKSGGTRMAKKAVKRGKKLSRKKVDAKVQTLNYSRALRA